MKISTMLKIVLVIILPAMIMIFNTNETEAIPAFARKYKTSCATCHIAVSKRNAFGEAFRRNGYVMTNQNARLVKEQPLKLGADAWKDVWPDAVWPSDIPGVFPVAGITQLRTEYNLEEKGKEHFEFNFPLDFVLGFGGAFGDDIGFFGAWSYNYGLNRLFLTFNDIIGPKDLFNLKVGAFPVGITDGYLDNQRLTMTQVSVLDYSPSGSWKPNTIQAGLELNGIFEHFLQYNIGIVNGEGRTRSDLSHEKDYYARISYKFGGYGLDGYGLTLDSASIDFNSDDSFTLGIYTYFGNTLTNAQDFQFINKFTRYGGDAKLSIGNLDIIAGLIAGNDERPHENLYNLKSFISFLEADYIFYPWLIGILRFEQINTSYEKVDVDKFYRLIPNICILIRQNVRLSAEAMMVLNTDKKNNDLIVAANNDKPLQWIKMNILFAF